MVWTKNPRKTGLTGKQSCIIAWGDALSRWLKAGWLGSPQAILWVCLTVSLDTDRLPGKNRREERHVNTKDRMGLGHGV